MKKLASLRSKRVRLALGLWTFLLIAVTWQTDPLAGGINVDEGTIVALHLWAGLHISYVQEVHTHGPLDFLFHPKALNWTSVVLPLIFLTVWNAAMIAAIYNCIRLHSGRGLAVLITTLAMFVLPNRHSYYPDSGFVLILAISYLLVHAHDRFRYGPELLAVFAGVFVFIKVSLTLFTLVAVLVIGGYLLRRVASLARALLIFVVVTFGTWGALGQSPTTLPQWFHRTSQATSGYGRAFGLQTFSFATDLLAAVLMVVLGLYLAQKLAPKRERVAMSALTLVAIYLIAKEGLTRDDAWHLVLCFGLVPVVYAVISKRPAVQIIFLAMGLVSCLSFFGTFATFKPQRSAVMFGRAIAYTFDSQSRNEATVLYKARLRNSYKMPESVRLATAQHPVALTSVDPGIAFAYGLNWKPQPVWQVNLAETPFLDQLNTSYLTKHQPDVLWNSNRPTDNRVELHQDPDFYYQLLCSYRTVVADQGWMLLTPGPNRCSAPRQIDTQVLRSKSDAVAIPTPSDPNDAVIVSYDETPINSIKTALFQATKYPDAPAEIINDKSHPLVMSTADAPLIVHVPSTAGWNIPIYGLNNGAESKISLSGVNFPVRVTFSEVSLNAQ